MDRRLMMFWVRNDPWHVWQGKITGSCESHSSHDTSVDIVLVGHPGESVLCCCFVCLLMCVCWMAQSRGKVQVGNILHR